MSLPDISFSETVLSKTSCHNKKNSIHFFFKYRLFSEITEELSNGPIRPTTPDREVLESINRISQEKASSVQAQQNDIYDSILSQEHTDEQMFYGHMRATMRQQEKLVEDFQAYVDRTSNYDSLKSAKREQNQAIEASRGSYAKYRKDKSFHMTNIEGDLNTTVFSGKFVNADHVADHDVIKTKPMMTTATSSRREARFSAD